MLSMYHMLGVCICQKVRFLMTIEVVWLIDNMYISSICWWYVINLKVDLLLWEDQELCNYYSDLHCSLPSRRGQWFVHIAVRFFQRYTKVVYNSHQALDLKTQINSYTGLFLWEAAVLTGHKFTYFSHFLQYNFLLQISNTKTLLLWK